MKKTDFILSVDDSLSDIWSLRKRGQRDAERHRERIRKAAKENMREIISQEDIISTDGTGKKIKVPIKYLEQWRFKNGKNGHHASGRDHNCLPRGNA